MNLKTLLKTDTLDINEIFGPTVQGEGSAAGRHCLFVRLAHCNLECTWCDTAYTWAWSSDKAGKTVSGVKYDKSTNLKVMTVEEILAALSRRWSIYTDPTMIVISGGEPLMQARRLEPLVTKLAQSGNAVHIETAGTLLPTEALNSVVAQYNVSPKLQHSGNKLAKRYKPEVLQWFARLSTKAQFKFVVTELADLNEVDAIVQECGILKRRVMLMPEGNTIAKNQKTVQALADEIIARGYGISLRTHVIIWPHIDRGI